MKVLSSIPIQNYLSKKKKNNKMLMMILKSSSNFIVNKCYLSLL